MISSKITGTGTFIPSLKKENAAFLEEEFLNADGSAIASNNEVIIEKFKAITGIQERRYAIRDHKTSDLGFFAAERAIEDAKVDKEKIDYIIFAHNSHVLEMD